MNDMISDRRELVDFLEHLLREKSIDISAESIIHERESLRKAEDHPLEPVFPLMLSFKCSEYQDAGTFIAVARKVKVKEGTDYAYSKKWDEPYHFEIATPRGVTAFNWFLFWSVASEVYHAVARRLTLVGLTPVQPPPMSEEQVREIWESIADEFKETKIPYAQFLKKHDVQAVPMVQAMIRMLIDFKEGEGLTKDDFFGKLSEEAGVKFTMDLVEENEDGSIVVEYKEETGYSEHTRIIPVDEDDEYEKDT